MAPISTPTLILPREEWPDADFDLPEGAPLHAPSDKDDDDDEDWDIEMDLRQTGDAKVVLQSASLVTRSEGSSPVSAINIRPPLHLPDFEDEDDGEGVSTIKATALPATLYSKGATKPAVEAIDEDFEDAFALPTDLTQLSLAPLSLSHRASKNSLEWGDKENSSSSQSSDAYSSLGFADASPSSNSTSCVSLPDTETEEEGEEEDHLEGLVLPSSLFESGQSARQLQKILETKKRTQPNPHPVNISSPDPDDDFEMGLIINDDVDLSPSRLVSSTQSIKSQRNLTRSSSSIPLPRTSSLRPPSRLKLERSKSPANPPTSSARQLQKIRPSPSPPLRPPSRSQNLQVLVSSLPSSVQTPSPSQNFFSTKPGSLRGQKSHSGLKPPTPPSSTRKLTRKASMSSLIESSHPQTPISDPSSKPSRYNEPTAASRAKAHKNSTSRIHDFKTSSSRPTTPSSNPAAQRLTMPTQSRLRSRPALSQVFVGSSTQSQEQAIVRSISPLPLRPPSSLSVRESVPPRRLVVSPSAPKLLRRPKRIRTYGDGTELDGIEDLPTDRDKEVRYRVQPKGYGNRIPGATFGSKVVESDKSLDKGIVATGKKGKRDGPLLRGKSFPSFYGRGVADLNPEPPTHSLKRVTSRIEFPSSVPPPPETLPKKKKNVSSPSSLPTKRKPTLIRNLGGSGTPKVIGDMKWNPQSLRWEGNDQVLREFDMAVGTSTRPALITHLSGSAVGSPVGSFVSGSRIVGNMVFDPARMCWISTLPPDEDEPDVFANLADDEEDSDSWESKGGTIRANVPRASNGSTAGDGSDPRTEAPSPAHSHSRTISESGSDRGSRASMVVCEVDDTFIESCRQAEERHRIEMKGWKTTLSKISRRDTSLPLDRTYLFEIRELATRKY